MTYRTIFFKKQKGSNVKDSLWIYFNISSVCAFDLIYVMLFTSSFKINGILQRLQEKAHIFLASNVSFIKKKLPNRKQKTIKLLRFSIWRKWHAMIHPIWVWWQESVTPSDPQPLRRSLSSRKPTRTHVTFPKKLPQRQILWPTSALLCLSMYLLFIAIRFKARVGVDLNQTAESLHIFKRCVAPLLPNIIFLFLCETGEQMPWESYRILTHTQTGADVCLLFSLKDKMLDAIFCRTACTSRTF